MYVYDEYDQRIIEDRVKQFRDQTRRYLAGELSEEEFRPLRLQNGLYIQRFAPMLRVAVPYGQLTSRQTRMMAKIARDYDKGYAHISTRQNVQFNWPALEDIPDILAELATVQMHAIQTSGNCLRNVTTDQFAGVAADELIDPRPWCEIVRQWTTFHPEFAYLPRKFKIAINGSTSDRAAIEVHDIGLEPVHNAAGELGFRVLVGGGLGRTPVVGAFINEFLPWQDLLSYLDAILRVYNRYGRRDNKYKARIKILVKALTPEVFAQKVDAEMEHLRGGQTTLTEAEVHRVAKHFVDPEYKALDNQTAELAELDQQHPGFARWRTRNTLAHKKPGYVAVTLSLKPTGVAPGDITDKQLDAVADLADRYSFGQLRTSHEQNIILADVEQSQLFDPVGRTARARFRHAEHRLADRHHLLPGRRFLLPGQRQVDPDRRIDPAPFRRPGLPVRHRRTGPEHLRLHERLWSPPRRPHRHPRGGQERRRVLPGFPGRQRQPRCEPGQDPRPVLRPGRHA